MRHVESNHPRVEPLESRRLLAGSPLGVVSIPAAGGGYVLHVTGTAGDDAITVARSGKTWTVRNGGAAWRWIGRGTNFVGVAVSGVGGNDAITIHPSVTCAATVRGGAGDDTLAAGAGRDKVFGDAGDDTLVSVGGRGDALAGGAGDDVFWADRGDALSDVSRAESAAGAANRVGQFAKLRGKPVSIDPRGEDLPDPRATGSGLAWKDFAGRPLFATTGPGAADVHQGATGDCWFLATLSSVAGVDPDAIRARVVGLGDGTFAVRFADARGAATYVRVDGDLPVRARTGTPVYARPGAQQSIWVALMEKAYAFVRTGAGTYASLDGGWMSEACDALGLRNTSTFAAASADELLAMIERELAAGRSVTFAVDEGPQGSGLIGQHAYAVVGVIVDSAGAVVGLMLRNPWGVDGYDVADGRDDGYVSVSAAHAFEGFLGITSAAC